jgi:hypothetical protein
MMNLFDLPLPVNQELLIAVKAMMNLQQINQEVVVVPQAAKTRQFKIKIAEKLLKL